MRIHIENLTNKAEDHESEMEELRSAFEEEIATLKREKRRLDDLMTIREQEIDSLRTYKERAEEEMQVKLEHLEQKYERQLTRIKEEFLKSS